MDVILNSPLEAGGAYKTCMERLTQELYVFLSISFFLSSALFSAMTQLSSVSLLLHWRSHTRRGYAINLDDLGISTDSDLRC